MDSSTSHIRSPLLPFTLAMHGGRCATRVPERHRGERVGARYGRDDLFRNRAEYLPVRATINGTPACGGMPATGGSAMRQLNSITPVMIVRSAVSCTDCRLSASVYRFVMI